MIKIQEYSSGVKFSDKKLSTICLNTYEMMKMSEIAEVIFLNVAALFSIISIFGSKRKVDRFNIEKT